MNYDEFRAAFLESLRESGLPTLGPPPHEEVLDLRSAERTLKVHVEPVGRDVGRPFYIAGTISWRWDALQTARTLTTEEDLLREVLGEEDTDVIETERPWLRIDIKLRAGLEHGKSLPLPDAKVWARWSREALGRLEEVERLVSEETTRLTPEGRHAILAWQGDPEITITCNALGQLRLQAVEIRAFQGIDLPRKWGDSEREPDEAPYRQLAHLFKRVKAALYAWGEVMDHLRKPA